MDPSTTSLHDCRSFHSNNGSWFRKGGYTLAFLKSQMKDSKTGIGKFNFWMFNTLNIIFFNIVYFNFLTNIYRILVGKML